MVFNLRVNCCPKKDRIRVLKETDCWESKLHCLSGTKGMVSVKKLIVCNWNTFFQLFSMALVTKLMVNEMKVLQIS